MQDGVCFTGHRTVTAQEQRFLAVWLPEQIRTLYARGFRTFYNGAAMGFDIIAAEAVLALRAECPQIRLHLLLPCRTQSRGWSVDWQKRYAVILAQADQTEILEEDRPVSRETFLRRDRALVDRSAVCIAFCKRMQSGTGYTVRYARQCGREVLLAAGKPTVQNFSHRFQ